MSDSLANHHDMPQDEGPLGSSNTTSEWLVTLKQWGITCEEKLSEWGDYLNPILVKETRQALKSRQFLITFILVLGACWVTTMAGIAIVGPRIYYMASGPQMLIAYFVILAFPLLVIVPFSAFRSLLSEQEANTYDVLAVSTLSPQRIIAGKLGSAAVQMVVLLSAVAPCLAFTYLLRGLDIITIGMLLIYVVLGSLGLSMLGLLLAAQASQRYGQMVLSVGLIILLLLAFWSVMGLAFLLLESGHVVFRLPTFWVMNCAILTAYITTFLLLFAATQGLIGYESSNRSTAIRLAMVLQFACFTGWMTVAFFEEGCDTDVLLTYASFAGIYWFAMGAMVTGESPELSRRAMRTLPDTETGRFLLSWLMPGPGLGLMFVVANLATVSLVVLAGLFYANMTGQAGTTPGPMRIVLFLITGLSYVVAYLSLGKILTRTLRHFAEVTLVGGFLVNVLLVLAGSGIPYSIQMSSSRLRGLDYSNWQLANPFWSLGYLIEANRLIDIAVIITVIPPIAVCLFLLNFPSIAKEMRQSRLALPKRVAEDEAALNYRPPTPSSPWDQQQGDEDE